LSQKSKNHECGRKTKADDKEITKYNKIRMTRSLIAFVFVILVIVIIFLMFQVNDNSNKCKELKFTDQDRLTRAQDHPLLSFEAIIESKLIMEELLSRHGGVGSTEKNLKLPKGRLEILRTKIYEQYGLTVDRYPELNFISNGISEETSSEDRRGKHERHKHRKHRN
jgi:predicted nucleic acid-binding Zn ribbon protein